MSFGTKIYTWFYGKLVSIDDFGNKYYCDSRNFESETAKRWVIFNGEIEASKIPPHWHAWLHKTIHVPPIHYSHEHNWQKNHQPNLSGTSRAYYPSSHPLSKSKNNVKDNAEYEKWHP